MNHYLEFSREAIAAMPRRWRASPSTSATCATSLFPFQRTAVTLQRSLETSAAPVRGHWPWKSRQTPEWMRLVAAHTSGRCSAARASWPWRHQFVRATRRQRWASKALYCHSQAEAEASACPLIVTNYR